MGGVDIQSQTGCSSESDTRSSNTAICLNLTVSFVSRGQSNRRRSDGNML